MNVVEWASSLPWGELERIVVAVAAIVGAGLGILNFIDRRKTPRPSVQISLRPPIGQPRDYSLTDVAIHVTVANRTQATQLESIELADNPSGYQLAFLGVFGSEGWNNQEYGRNLPRHHFQSGALVTNLPVPADVTNLPHEDSVTSCTAFMIVHIASDEPVKPVKFICRFRRLSNVGYTGTMVVQSHLAAVG